MLVLLSLSGVATWNVGDLMLEVRMTAVNSRLVHTDFELAGPRERRVGVSVVILIQGVKVVVLASMGGFDQSVDHNHQQD